MTEGKIAVLGDPDFCMPFAAMGLDIYPAQEDGDSLRWTATEIVAGNYALVVVAEDKFSQIDDIFAKVSDIPTPCVVVVPFTGSGRGIATESLGRVLKLATGIDVFADPGPKGREE